MTPPSDVQGAVHRREATYVGSVRRYPLTASGKRFGDLALATVELACLVASAHTLAVAVGVIFLLAGDGGGLGLAYPTNRGGATHIGLTRLGPLATRLERCRNLALVAVELARLVAADHTLVVAVGVVLLLTGHCDSIAELQALGITAALTAGQSQDHPEIPIDNSVSEREYQKVAKLRPNMLFAGSTEGAHRAAALLGIVATCRALGVDTEAYLSWAFTRLGTHRDLHPLTVADLTPAAFHSLPRAERGPP